MSPLPRDRPGGSGRCEGRKTPRWEALSVEQERLHLEQADRAIKQSERRIADQAERIARLRADGHDVFEYEEVLATFRFTLTQQRTYRATIVTILTALV